MAESAFKLPRVMTVHEAAAYLRVHPGTIYRLLRNGELPAFKIGGDWRFNVDQIDRWSLKGGTSGDRDGGG
jgi:excisionase family DNA binding protein